MANHYARLAVPVLAAQLRLNAAFELKELSQSTFGYFLDSLAPHTVTATLALAPLAGRFLATLDPTLALVVIDLLLGGRGLPMPPRNLTDIEFSLLRRFLSRLLGQLPEAISEEGEFRVELEGLESNPLFAQILGPTDTVATVRFELRLEHAAGDFCLTLPHELLEPILPRIADRAHSEPHPSEAWDLSAVPLTLAACLGTVELPLRQFLALEPGDILTLNTRLNRPIELQANGRPLFLGRVGTVGRELVFEIQNRFVKGETLGG